MFGMIEGRFVRRDMLAKAVLPLLLFCVSSIPPGLSEPAGESVGATTDAPASTTDVHLDRFEPMIRAFELRDRLRMPPAGCTVFVGSSTFAKWRNLEKTFEEFAAVNRGFGGSTIPEVNHYTSRIVTNYKPSKIVFYCGSNDIAELHHNGQQVFEDFKSFVQQVHQALPYCQIYFISESVAPSRSCMVDDFVKSNSLVQEFVKSMPYVHFIDVLPAMQNKDGRLRTDLFGIDRLHMTPEGYALWTPIIRTALNQQIGK